jgi:hypothetical protein
MPLTAHFSIEELTRTGTGLPNDAPLAVAGNLMRLCQDVLEPARDLVGPLDIDSGYRSPEVNKAVGGASASAHLDGRAADVVPTKVSVLVLFDMVRHSETQFDQCILEFGWVHLSVARMGERPRHQALKAIHVGGKVAYEYVQ